MHTVSSGHWSLHFNQDFSGSAVLTAEGVDLQLPAELLKALFDSSYNPLHPLNRGLKNEMAIVDHGRASVLVFSTPEQRECIGKLLAEASGDCTRIAIAPEESTAAERFDALRVSTSFFPLAPGVDPVPSEEDLVEISRLRNLDGHIDRVDVAPNTTRAPAENELPPSDHFPCSSPPGSRLSIAGMRVEDAWKLPRHHPVAPAVYVRDDGRLTIDSGEVDKRPFVGRLENWSYQESDDCLYGELVFYSKHSAGTVPADPAALAKGVLRKAAIESEAGPLTQAVVGFVARTLDSIAPSLDEQLDAVDAELMKQGLPPRPKKVVKPPALTQGEVFMRLGKDSQAKRWARALVDHQTSAYYWRTSSATGREVRQRVAKEHGPEFDEKLFLAVGGQNGKKGRDKSLSWEKLEQYVRLVPTEETAQDRQLGGDA